MKSCCTKLADGTTCPTPAIREITLQGGGLVFRVPICGACHAKLPQKGDAPKDEMQCELVPALRPRIRRQTMKGILLEQCSPELRAAISRALRSNPNHRRTALGLNGRHIQYQAALKASGEVFFFELMTDRSRTPWMQRVVPIPAEPPATRWEPVIQRKKGCPA